MTERELRALRDELDDLRVRIQNFIDLRREIERRKGKEYLSNYDWFQDPLFLNCRTAGYSIQRKLRSFFRRKK